MVRALLLLLLAAAAAGDPPYPEGKSTQKYADLTFYLVVPKEYDAEKEYSLLVALHGMDSSETSVASWFEELAAEDFVICGPRATGSTWNKPDIEKVKVMDPDRARMLLPHMYEALQDYDGEDRPQFEEALELMKARAEIV